MAAVIGLLRVFSTPEHRKLAAAVVLIAVLGVWLRLENQATLRAADSLQGAPLLDTAAYEQDARAMLAGGPLQPPVSYRPPGYPWFLASAYAIGFEADQIPGLQAGLDGLTTIGIAALVFAIWKSIGLALVAALLVALSPLLIYFSGEPLETSWMVFWVVAQFAALYRALETKRTTAWFVCGLCTGFAILIRPNLLLWLPVSCLGAWRAQGRTKALACLAASLLVIAPITLKNWIRGEQWIPISANGGVNLWLGNVPDTELHAGIPYYRYLPGPVASWQWEQLGKRAYEDGAESASGQSSWHQGEALAEMFRNPLRTLGLMAKKGLAFVNAFELSNNRDVYRAGTSYGFVGPGLQAIGGTEWLQWRLLLPLALLGAWACFRSGQPAYLRWVAVWAAVFACSVILFFVCARHRAPIFPAVLLLGLTGAREVFSWIRTRRIPLRLVGVLLLTLITVNIDWFGHRELYRGYVIDPVGVGRLQRGLGQFEQAEASYQLAIDRAPEDALAIAELGALRFQQVRPEEAEQLFEQSIAADPTRAESYNYLGLTRMELGRFSEALQAFEQTLEIQPEHGLALANKGRCLLILDRREEALTCLRLGFIVLTREGHPLASQVRALIDEVEAEG